jgi:hypothetical protein
MCSEVGCGYSQPTAQQQAYKLRIEGFSLGGPAVEYEEIAWQRGILPFAGPQHTATRGGRPLRSTAAVKLLPRTLREAKDEKKNVAHDK